MTESDKMIIAVAKALCEADGHDYEKVFSDWCNNRQAQMKYERMAYKAIEVLSNWKGEEE